MGYWFYFPSRWSFIFIDKPCTFLCNEYLFIHKHIFFSLCEREVSISYVSRRHALLLGKNLQKLTETSLCNFRRTYIVLIYLRFLFSNILFIQHFCLSSRVFVKIKTFLTSHLLLGLSKFHTRLYT